MEKYHQLGLPESGSKTYFLASDWHSHFSHRASINILYQAADHNFKITGVKPTLIIGGDFLDVDYFFAGSELFQTWIARKDGIDEFFLPKYQEEIEWGMNELMLAKQHFGEIIFMLGNHEERIDRVKHSITPSLHHLFDLKRDLKLDEMGIKMIPYNHWLDIGPHMTITHGMYHNSTCHKKHYDVSESKSVFFGHIHSHGVVSFTSRGKIKQSVSLPCMCHLNPVYLRNAESNWTNGFIQVNMKPNGLFNYYTYQIFDDECVMPHGEIFSGRE